MAICQCMIQDFMYGWGNEDNAYGRYDLEVGLDYAATLLSQGFKREPFHRYDLRKFKKWCEEKLKCSVPVKVVRVPGERSSG